MTFLQRSLQQSCGVYVASSNFAASGRVAPARYGLHCPRVRIPAEWWIPWQAWSIRCHGVSRVRCWRFFLGSGMEPTGGTIRSSIICAARGRNGVRSTLPVPGMLALETSARAPPNVGARCETSPESVAGFRFPNLRCGIQFERGSEGASQPRIFDMHHKPPESYFGRFVPSKQGVAEVDAGPAEEAEAYMPAGPMATAVDFDGNCHHVQSIRIVERHGQPQQRQLPCAQHPAVPFGRILRAPQ